MKKILVIILVVHIAFYGCGQSGSQTKNNIQSPESKINKTLPVTEFEQKMNSVSSTQLIDVRTPDEFNGGHLSNAKNISINASDFTAKMEMLDKAKPIFVYCLSGGRSSRAANELAQMGFSEVYNMEGGIMSWKAAGKSVMTKDAGAGSKSAGMSMDEFNEKIQSPNYVLVDFNAIWCAPCQKMLPILEALADKKKDKLSLLKIDADKNQDLIRQKNIASIPYMELYKNGKLVWHHNGFIEEKSLIQETKL